MPVSLIVNGVGYAYPVAGDENWAENATNWAVAVTQNLSSLNAALSDVSAGIFSLANGAVGSPSLRFTNSPTTGVYRIAPDTLGFSAAGVIAGQFNSLGAWILGPVAGGVTHSVRGGLSVSEHMDVLGSLAAGATSVSSLISAAGVSGTTGTFSGAVSGTSGTFSAALSGASLTTGAIIATSGTFSADLAAVNAVFSGNISGVNTALSGVVKTADGSAAATSYSFTNALGTGLFLRASNALGFSSNGVERGFFESTGVFNLLDAVNFQTRTVTTSTQTLDTTDTIVYCNRSGTIAITLPANVAGRFLVIKDISGAAGTNNITVTPASGTIDGAASITINTNYGSYILFGDGTAWRAIASSGSSSGAVRTVTGSTSLSASDNVVLVNQSAAVTMTLPSPVSGKVIEIKDISGTATVNTITVARSSSALIDGQTAASITMNYQSLRLISDGTNWYLV